MAATTANRGAISRAQAEKGMTAAEKAGAKGKAGQSVSVLLNSMLDSENYRRRFDELLGARAPQFISSVITLVNGDANLQKAFYEAPQTVIQAALKAATYDLPIDPSLGFAYIVPFSNSKKLADGTWQKRMEAAFILGYKGMIQLCMRTGAYKRPPDAVDVREGELISYDRLTGDCEFKWIEDEDERENKPIIVTCGYSDVYSVCSEEFSDKCRELSVPHILMLSPGVHSWAYWGFALEEHLFLFNKILKGENLGY